LRRGAARAKNKDMARRPMQRQRAWGEAIVSRLDEKCLPPELSKHVREFRAAQAGLDGATRRARRARERRGAAPQGLARADGALERAVLALAKRLVSSGIASKKSPFEDRSPFAPKQLAALDHAREVDEVEKLLATFRGQRVGVPVRRALVS